MKYLIFTTILLGLVFSCRNENKAKSFEQMLDRIETHYVADRRTDRVEVDHRSGFQGLYLSGYTTVPAAYDSLLAVLETGFVTAKNDVRLLPDTTRLGTKTYGIINVSVANLRSKPGHSQELATQALLGTPIQVLDNVDGWYLVRTPDRYLAWLEPGAFVLTTLGRYRDWYAGDLMMYTDPFGEIVDRPGGDKIVSDIVTGGLVQLSGEREKTYLGVLLPDDTKGWLPAAELSEINAKEPTAAFSPAGVMAVADGLSGRPYLWGGTSPKGMDCSGFTKMAYYLNGYVIPRDASQQVHAGTEIPLTDDFVNLEPGDLLFFGRYRQDGSEKITHVGIYTGEGRFHHAGADNGRITTQSLIEGTEDFAPNRRQSLLRARRLQPGTKGVVPLLEAFGVSG